MSEEKKFDRFGRYLILDHLVNGGMAKICRARFLGEQADKVVAIKMVQPQFSADESFKTMFMDEIKTTFGLLHPNIVQTYDYGLHNDQLFVAMEYCDGRNLKEYLDKLKERKFVFPVEISVYIVIQTCLGLHYAHTLTDQLTGKPANIIHRDISPHNIMLTFGGAVKVIDFGIAKSESNSEATQAGTIKGKLSYLAPEYLDGMELDPRYDLFAVGITLWEMLCSRKLFKASNDLAVLKKIQECKVPKPSSINPNVPAELDEIVLKALSKDREDRFSDLEEFSRALNKFLYSTYPDFNSADLSYFAKELFKDEIKTDRDKMVEFGQIDIKPYLEEMKGEQDGSNSNTVSENTSTEKKKKRVETELDFELEDGLNVSLEKDFTKSGISVNSKKSTSTKITNKSQSTGEDSTKVKSGVSKLDIGEVTKKTNLKQAGLTRTTTRTTGLKKKKKKKVSKIKKVRKESGGSRSLIVASIAVLMLIGSFFVYKGAVSEAVTSNDKRDTVSKERNPSSEKIVTNDNKGYLKIRGFKKRSDHKLFVDGQRKEDIVINKLELEAGSYTVRVEMPNYMHYQEDVEIVAGELKIIDVKNRPYASYGYLILGSDCFKGKVRFEMFGEKRTENIPYSQQDGIPFATRLDDSGVSSPEVYKVELIRANAGVSREYCFDISENSVVDVCSLLNSDSPAVECEKLGF